MSSILNQKWYPSLDDSSEADLWRQAGIVHILGLFKNNKILEKQTLNKKTSLQNVLLKVFTIATFS